MPAEPPGPAAARRWDGGRRRCQSSGLDLAIEWSIGGPSDPVIARKRPRTDGRAGDGGSIATAKVGLGRASAEARLGAGGRAGGASAAPNASKSSAPERRGGCAGGGGEFRALCKASGGPAIERMSSRSSTILSKVRRTSATLNIMSAAFSERRKTFTPMHVASASGVIRLKRAVSGRSTSPMCERRRCSARRRGASPSRRRCAA